MSHPQRLPGNAQEKTGCVPTTRTAASPSRRQGYLRQKPIRIHERRQLQGPNWGEKSARPEIGIMVKRVRTPVRGRNSEPKRDDRCEGPHQTVAARSVCPNLPEQYPADLTTRTLGPAGNSQFRTLWSSTGPAIPTSNPQYERMARAFGRATCTGARRKRGRDAAGAAVHRSVLTPPAFPWPCRTARPSSS